jgi:hypothetical protein
VRPYRYHPAAEQEFEEAIEHDEVELPGRGLRLEQQVGRVVFRLRRCPLSAPIWPGLDNAEVRRAKVRRHPFLVVYMVHRPADHPRHRSHEESPGLLEGPYRRGSAGNTTPDQAEAGAIEVARESTRRTNIVAKIAPSLVSLLSPGRRSSSTRTPCRHR